MGITPRADQLVVKLESRLPASTEDREDAFSRLLDESLDRSYRLAAVILGGREEAEDATHDAAVRAWQRMGTLRDPEKFEAWFQRILINVCRTRLRARQRPLALMPAPAQHDSTAESVEYAALQEVMATLTFEHRTVIALRYLADLTIEQIAERTGVPAGTVKSRLHYALRQLRAAYDAADRTPAETEQ
jgi:RNA polymerase sigma-70 factor (ECF subfamily)